PIGVDLRNFWNVIYPNSYGFSKTPAPELIDEERLIREPMSDTAKDKLMREYSGNYLATIVPHGSITCFRGFTFGNNRRNEIDASVYAYLVIGIDGALQMTDGLTAEEVIFPMNNKDAECAKMGRSSAPGDLVTRSERFTGRGASPVMTAATCIRQPVPSEFLC